MALNVWSLKTMQVGCNAFFIINMLAGLHEELVCSIYFLPHVKLNYILPTSRETHWLEIKINFSIPYLICFLKKSRKSYGISYTIHLKKGFELVRKTCQKDLVNFYVNICKYLLTIY